MIDQNIKIKTFLNNQSISALILNKELKIEFISNKAIELLKNNYFNLKNIFFTDFLDKDSSKTFKNKIRDLNKNILNQEIILTLINDSKTKIILDSTISLLSINNINYFIIIFVDITKLIDIQQSLKSQAFYDQLTSIPNRTLFFDRAKLSINQAQRSNHLLAIIYIDLDRFKNINDTYGHNIGDIFLKRISKRFLNIARKTDTVSRIGGDEFIILMPQINDINDPVNLAERIIKNNEKNIKINNIFLKPLTSIGIGIYPNDGKTIEELLNKADERMYKAKKLGSNMIMHNNKILN